MEASEIANNRDLNFVFRKIKFLSFAAGHNLTA